MVSNKIIILWPERGFSLLELLITLAILGVILVFVAPSFQTIVLNTRISMQVDGLVNALNFARETALTQNMSVQVCPFTSINSTTCGTNWTAGWIVITAPTSGSPTILQSSQARTVGPTVSVTGISTVTFNARGLASGQSNFTICDNRGASFARSVAVLPTGFVQSGQTMGQAIWDGGALVCS